MVGRAADPRLPAYVLVGKVGLAQFVEGDGGAHVRLTGDAPPFGVAIIVEALVITRLDAERARREQAVESLLAQRRAPQPRLHPLRPAAHRVRARRPIISGGGQLGVGGSRRDRGKGVRGVGALLHPPRGQAGRPGGLGRPLAGAGPRRLGEAEGGSVVADDVIGPGDALLELRERLRRDLRQPARQRGFGVDGLVVDDERGDLGIDCRGDRVARRGGDLGAAGLAALPDHRLRRGEGRQLRRAAGGGETGELVRLGKLRRPAQKSEERLRLNLGRTLGEEDFRPQRVVERPLGRGVELRGRPQPVAGADRAHHVAIGAALRVVEHRRRRGRVARFRRQGRRGRERQRCGEEQGAERLHCFTSSTSFCRSAQACAFALGWLTR